jgi:hypothetical protein
MYARLLRGFAPSRPTRRTNTKRRLAVENLEGRQLLSLGAEFPINSITSGAEITPVTATSSNGSSVVVWAHSFGTGIDLQAQRFNAQGIKVGSQMFIAGKVGVNMTQPSVAMDAHGDFVVSWTQSPGAGGSDVFAQKIAANGVQVNGIVPVGVGTFAESQPSVAMDAAGDFVVAYTRLTNQTTPNVFAKVYNTNSQLLSVEPVAGTQFRTETPSVAMTPTGQFDVAYDFVPTGSPSEVFVDRFAFNGTLLQLTPIPPAALPGSGVPNAAPSIAMDNNGNAVVAFQQLDGNNWDIFATRLSAAGSVGNPIKVAATSLNEMTPSVALEGNGGKFVVAYQSFSSVNVTEVNASDVVVSTQTAGPSRFSPHVSIINGPNILVGNHFLLTYMTQTPPSNSENIAGRLGSL